MNITDQQQLDTWLKNSTKKSGVPLKVADVTVIAQVTQLVTSKVADQ